MEEKPLHMKWVHAWCFCAAPQQMRTRQPKLSQNKNCVVEPERTTFGCFLTPSVCVLEPENPAFAEGGTSKFSFTSPWGVPSHSWCIHSPFCSLCSVVTFALQHEVHTLGLYDGMFSSQLPSYWPLAKVRSSIVILLSINTESVVLTWIFTAPVRGWWGEQGLGEGNVWRLGLTGEMSSHKTLTNAQKKCS